jgi:hypothetical protein
MQVTGRQDPATYDVAVVGGGAAGLSGALMLGRAKRSVLIIDAGEPRNSPAFGVHGFLTRDGMNPAALLEAGRAEVCRYGAQVLDGRVASAAPLDGGFAVELEDGRRVGARRLLVTTELVDELPNVPGVRERWGRDVLHCPYCHGWEVRDQPIGVLASNSWAAHQALLFRQWTADLTLFLHTAPQPTDAEAEQLAARSITVVEGEVSRLSRSSRIASRASRCATARSSRAGPWRSCRASWPAPRCSPALALRRPSIPSAWASTSTPTRPVSPPFPGSGSPGTWPISSRGSSVPPMRAPAPGRSSTPTSSLRIPIARWLPTAPSARPRLSISASPPRPRPKVRCASGFSATAATVRERVAGMQRCTRPPSARNRATERRRTGGR